MAPDGPDSSQQWYLEAKGQKSGPFTPQEIGVLLKEGSIQQDDVVTHPDFPGKTMNVRDFLNYYFPGSTSHSKPEPANSRPGTFEPPPRPDIPRSATNEVEWDHEPTNPALSLFDTLQAARERKPKQEFQDIDLMHAPEIRNRIWLTLTIGMGLIAAVWSLTHLIPKAEVETTAPRVSSIKDSEPAHSNTTDSASAPSSSVSRVSTPPLLQSTPRPTVTPRAFKLPPAVTQPPAAKQAPPAPPPAPTPTFEAVPEDRSDDFPEFEADPLQPEDAPSIAPEMMDESSDFYVQPASIPPSPAAEPGYE